MISHNLELFRTLNLKFVQFFHIVDQVRQVQNDSLFSKQCLPTYSYLVAT